MVHVRDEVFLGRNVSAAVCTLVSRALGHLCEPVIMKNPFELSRKELPDTYEGTTADIATGCMFLVRGVPPFLSAGPAGLSASQPAVSNLAATFNTRSAQHLTELQILSNKL